MQRQSEGNDPHVDSLVLLDGAPLDEAAGAIIALHGRGGDAADIVALAQQVAPPGVAIVAPQAAGNSWYPVRFIEPFERNEPYLSSALRKVENVIEQVSEAGIPSHRIALLGFSQGACLALEAAARHAQRYAALIGFSGGLIGPPGTRFEYGGSLAGTPVFLGCSDVDSHIPVERVEETAVALERLGAVVDTRIYPGMGHTINREELDAARSLLAGAITSS